ncbi:hypothetical protein Tco_1506042 [Tanacetum coccineum]
MSSDTKLTKDEECESVDSTKYRGMIGSLLYLTASRPDIMLSVCLCARFQEAPKTSHLEAVKRIFQYIKATTHLGLWYPKGTGIETIVYADSDHAGDYVDRKRTSGICTFVGCCLTSWLFKHVVSVSPKLAFDRYLSHDRAMHPLAPHYERKTRVDRGKKRPRETNASSSPPTLNHPSLSHPLVDPTDENDDESSHSNPSSPSQNISSSSNNVSRVHQNPPCERHYLNTYLSETINLQT